MAETETPLERPSRLEIPRPSEDFSSDSGQVTHPPTKRSIVKTFSSWATQWLRIINKSCLLFLLLCRRRRIRLLESLDYKYSTVLATLQTVSSSPSMSTTDKTFCPMCEKRWLGEANRRDLRPLTKSECHQLKNLFQEKTWHLYQTQLDKLQTALVVKLRRSPSKEQLDDINGQIHCLMVIQTLPSQIEKELKEILAHEDQERERKELEKNARSRI